MTPKYKRILLKLSGEALMGEDAFGINRQTIESITAEIAQVSRMGVEIAVVIGGGNIFRGVAPGAAGMDRATADYMGMLATVMNALALQDAMRHAGLASRALSALNIEQVIEPYIRGKAIRYLEEGTRPDVPVPWAFVHGILRESLERRARDAGRWVSHHQACAEMLQRTLPIRYV